MSIPEDLAYIQNGNGFSLKKSLEHILNTYSTAKTEPFASHPLGVMVRRTIPDYFRKLSFIPQQIRDVPISQKVFSDRKDGHILVWESVRLESSQAQTNQGADCTSGY